MAQSFSKSRVTDLQKLVDGWLRQLSSLELPQSSTPTKTLSPLKKDKHALSAQSDNLAPHVLLRLLAQRVAELSLNEFSSILLDWLTVPLSSTAEDLTIQKIRQEIALLDESVLTGWGLAGLNLWSAQSLQKRSGAFYTSAELARYITAKTSPPDQRLTTWLDPACGGGAFLLASLELLHERHSELSLAELLVGHLYGVDLNPVAVGLCRLALLRRLAELKGSMVTPALAMTLLAQIRCGNAIVGSIAQLGLALELALELAPDLGLSPRVALFQAIKAVDFDLASRLYIELEALLLPQQAALAQYITELPLFNLPGQGAELATLQPFGWQLEFPEVFAEGGFGVVVGNPPYVGFNDYSGIEKAYFASTFKEVYNLKSDLFYYFFLQGFRLLRESGRLGFVVSRFWKEAVFAAPLRQWLTAATRLLEIEDLGEQQLFQTAQVDVCLVFFSRETLIAEHTFPFSFEGRQEQIQQTSLSQAPWAWLRRQPVERSLLAKIAAQSQPLGQLANCRTGVQTGLDRVFFLTGQQLQVLALEPAIVRKAIKNRDISPNHLTWHDLWLIYPSPGFEPARYPALLRYLEPYQENLERRRRYDEEFPFYQLQWPREVELFETPVKLVTPYKAPHNTFAIDRNQFYFSTDVISINFAPGWGYEQLAVNFLNSSLSTFQFRSFGKPVGGGQWDYYANPVKRLAFPNLSQADPALLAALSVPNLSQTEIDKLVFELYGLSSEESQLITRVSQGF